MSEVFVDNDFVRFGSKSYAINKITSIEVREERPHALGCAYALFFLAGIFALLTLGAPFLVVLPLLLGWFGYRQWKKSKIVDYQLFLITSASETQAFTTRNAEEIADLRERIERAMTINSRGRTDR